MSPNEVGGEQTKPSRARIVVIAVVFFFTFLNFIQQLLAIHLQ